ncbi:hypothetical protein [[Mycobacterium] crassicus]|uniref:PE-PPE domain-containing protein n=1 Tax=[Mycobacterium] crassicus TaxID=2872309 RepID=A0ABU5XIR5_9MYCO|nr:hypothetical protein [Mycolicibacter sp. MYC098]MEB3021197.1 hypothetical protein [Mycolicibacter sp. MYC098]
MAVAVIGACLIAIPPSVPPTVQSPAVALASVGDLMVNDLGAGGVTAVVDVLTGVDPGTALAGVPDQYYDYLDGLGIPVEDQDGAIGGLVAATAALAHLIASLFTDPFSWLMNAIDWVANLFGFDLFPDEAASALATAVPNFDLSVPDVGIPGLDLSNLLADFGI